MVPMNSAWNLDGSLTGNFGFVVVLQRVEVIVDYRLFTSCRMLAESDLNIRMTSPGFQWPWKLEGSPRGYEGTWWMVMVIDVD